MRCNNENPDDTLQCLECGQVDPLASREELAVWQGALHAEQHRSVAKSPKVKFGIILTIILGSWLGFKSFQYTRSVADAGRFEAVAECHGSGGLGMPSPPCSAASYHVTGIRTLGYQDVVPKNVRHEEWLPLVYVAEMKDDHGEKRDAGLQDQQALNAVFDSPDVTAVEYHRKIVALVGNAGDFPTTDNPNVVLSMDRTELIQTIGFDVFVVLLFVGMEASGRYAARKRLELYDRRED